MLENEIQFIRSFVLPSRQRRYFALLEKKGRRDEFVAKLDHYTDHDIDDAYASYVFGDKSFKESVLKVLLGRGAPHLCYIFSTDSKIDGRTMYLDAALDNVIGCGAATVVSCIPGKLAYFEGHEANDRFILER